MISVNDVTAGKLFATVQGEGANVPAGVSMRSRSENAILAIEPCFKGFDSITVNDLCSAADLNRGTFYNHFRDKEHLLESFEDEVMRDLVAIQAQMESIEIKEVVAARFTKRPLPFLVDLFDYLSKQGAFLHAVLGPGGDIRFGPRLRDSVCAHLIQSVLHEQYRNDPTAFVDYYLAFYASAYLGVITHWIETGMKESSEEMALIAMRLLFIRPGEPIRM